MSAFEDEDEAEQPPSERPQVALPGPPLLYERRLHGVLPEPEGKRGYISALHVYESAAGPRVVTSGAQEGTFQVIMSL
jgi:hypothetical protein